MEKVEQVLKLDPPHELRFKGPFEDVVPSKLELQNTSDRPVSFKVKTTAPRRYCVRPNSGVVPPSGKVSVTLMLQPFEFDPREKNKHKFMVQALYSTEGDLPIDEQFKQAKPDQLMETKLRCVFEMPADENAPASTSALSSSPPSAEAQGVPASPALNASQKEASSSKDVNQLQQQLANSSEEIKKLRSECSQLRQENMIIKEEKLQLQRAAGSNKGSVSASLPPPHQEMGAGLSQMHLAVAFILLLVGYLIGKLIL